MKVKGFLSTIEQKKQI